MKKQLYWLGIGVGLFSTQIFANEVDPNTQVETMETTEVVTQSDSSFSGEQEVINKKVQLEEKEVTTSRELPISFYDYVTSQAKSKGYKVYWNVEDLGFLTSKDLKKDVYESNNWKEKIAQAIQDLNEKTARVTDSTRINTYFCDVKTIVASPAIEFEKFRNSVGLKKCSLMDLTTETKYFLPSGKEYKEGMEIKEEDLKSKN